MPKQASQLLCEKLCSVGAVIAAMACVWGLASCTSRPRASSSVVTNSSLAVSLPHDTCRALGAASLPGAFEECTKVIGQAQAFARAGLPLCSRVAQAVQGAATAVNSSSHGANEAIDCLRGLSNVLLTAEGAQGCAQNAISKRAEKTPEGLCVSGAVDPFDCLEPLGRCLRSSAELVVSEDVVPAGKALASVEPFRSAILRGDFDAAQSLADNIVSAEGGAIESRPPLSDLSGVPAGYAPSDLPLPLPESLSNALAANDPLRARVFYLEPRAVDFCNEISLSEDCVRAIVNFEFSASDLSLCKEAAKRTRAVACLYAVRQVHKKGYIRRSKLQADVLGALAELHSTNVTEAAKRVNVLHRRLQAF